jgi:NADPH-dependent 2,4-dienoyl-CoA reductase/sulfur reductase-like enzyme
MNYKFPLFIFLLLTLKVKATDVVVYSGVPCGIAEAIAAAREGSNVILIEPTKRIGGLSSASI